MKAFHQICLCSELVMLLTYCFRRGSPWPTGLKELWLLWTFAGPLALPYPLWIIRGIWRYCWRSQFVSFTLHIVEASWINHQQGKKINFFRHIFWWVMRENVKWSVKYSTDPLSIRLLYLQANFMEENSFFFFPKRQMHKKEKATLHYFSGIWRH